MGPKIVDGSRVQETVSCRRLPTRSYLQDSAGAEGSVRKIGILVESLLVLGFGLDGVTGGGGGAVGALGLGGSERGHCD